MARISPAMQKFWDASELYLRSLEGSGAEPTTVNNYARVIERFRQFWEERITRDHSLQTDPSVADMIEWRAELSQKGASVTTIHYYLTTIDRMFAFASDESLGDARVYEKSPVSKRLIPSLKKVSSRPYDEILPGEKVALLWNSAPAKKQRQSWAWVRNYAIVVIILSTGIRNDELLSLRLRDISWEYEELAVEHGKGDKFRMVDFPPIAQTALRMYLDSGLRPAHLTDDDYIFGTQRGKGKQGRGALDKDSWEKGSQQWLSGLIERHVEAVTGTKGVTSHDLRHLAARLDLNNGMSIEELQSKLGHSDMKTTQIYSGKILARRKRLADIAAFDERDVQARENLKKIENPPEPPKRNRRYKYSEGSAANA